MIFSSSIYKLTLYTLLAIAFCAMAACKKDVLYPTSTDVINTGAVADINSILFINDTLGYIVGGEKYESTELLTTTDRGKTWQRYYTEGNGSKAVNSIAYNGNNVIAAGYEGKVYTPKSTPNDWQTTQMPDWVWFQHITFAAPNKGFIVSGEGYAVGNIYTIDSVLNFKAMDSLPYQLCDIAFANEMEGYTCGYGVMMKTIDGGDTWQLQNIQGDFFRSLSVVDAQNVWAAGYNGTIIHTKDGGVHWDKQRNGNDPLLAKYRFRGIVFKDLNTGYAVGDKGLIVKTIDGGMHWSLFKKTTDNDLKCITVQKDGSLWIGGSNGLVLHIKE